MVLLILALGLSLVALAGCAPGQPTRRGVSGPRVAAAPPPVTSPPAGPLAPPESAPATVDPQRLAAKRLADRGRAELGAGRLAEAGELLERAVAVDPTCTEGYYHLARLHVERGEYGLALAFLDKAEQVGTDDAAALGEIIGLRGTVLEALGRTEDARAAYERALRVAPGDVRARVGLGRVGGAPPDADQ
jgi:tetratricopeptide (TPR) repeat protein